jgi:dihydroneopterin aldolase
MQAQIDAMSKAHRHLESACHDFKAAAKAYEKHRDTLHYEDEFEAHEHKLKEEQTDLLSALAYAQIALGDAFAEHLRRHHARPM